MSLVEFLAIPVVLGPAIAVPVLWFADGDPVLGGVGLVLLLPFLLLVPCFGVALALGCPRLLRVERPEIVRYGEDGNFAVGALMGVLGAVLVLVAPSLAWSGDPSALLLAVGLAAGGGSALVGLWCVGSHPTTELGIGLHEVTLRRTWVVVRTMTRFSPDDPFEARIVEGAHGGQLVLWDPARRRPLYGPRGSVSELEAIRRDLALVRHERAPAEPAALRALQALRDGTEQTRISPSSR